MLVLSRRPNETLVFPGLQTTIQVVSIKKGSDLIRLGVSDDFGNPKPTQKREETHHEQ